MKQKFFISCRNVDEARTRAFALKEMFELQRPENKSLRLEVEAEYHFMKDFFRASENSPEAKDTEPTQEEIMKKLSPLNLNVEVCGKWVWVYGNTKPHKDYLKKLRLRFSPGKKCWYWRPDKYRSINTEPMDMDEIRRKHGSSRVA